MIFWFERDSNPRGQEIDPVEARIFLLFLCNYLSQDIAGCFHLALSHLMCLTFRCLQGVCNHCYTLLGHSLDCRAGRQVRYTYSEIPTSAACIDAPPSKDICAGLCFIICQGQLGISGTLFVYM